VKEMKEDIVAVLSTIGGDVLQRGWDELDYRIGVRRVTRGAHIEYL
jgi:hypothetical protein